MSGAATSGIRWRQITDDDLTNVAGLLSSGFLFRSKNYWLRGLRRQADRALPEGSPKYGYVLLHDARVVGAILMFSSNVGTRGETFRRCNLSSWYVDPKYRNYGSLLITSAMKDKSTTYFNVSPAMHTWKTVEAQGFKPYCLGEMAVLPLLTARAEDARIEVIGPDASRSSHDDMLRQHAHYGCLSLIIHSRGQAYPFVFQKQRMLKRLIPCFRLIYCNDIADFVRFAGNIGGLMLRYGRPIVVIDANEPIVGLVGRYTEKRGRKYARGPHIPRLGDLAFTEGVFFN